MCLRYDKATWQRDKLFAEEAARETIRAHRMRRLLAAASFISVVEGGDDNENENNKEMEEEEIFQVRKSLCCKLCLPLSGK